MLATRSTIALAALAMLVIGAILVWRLGFGRSAASPPSASDDAKGSTADAGAARVVTIRDLALAKRFPLEPPGDARRRKHGEVQSCDQHHVPLERVVLTTGGPLGEIAVWHAYPLAMDAWECPVDHNYELPAFLTPEEVTDFNTRGGELARAGELNEAEFLFRRVVASWPGFMSGHANLGSVYVDRIRDAERAGTPLSDLKREIGIAIDRRNACPALPTRRRRDKGSRAR